MGSTAQSRCWPFVAMGSRTWRSCVAALRHALAFILSTQNFLQAIDSSNVFSVIGHSIAQVLQSLASGAVQAQVRDFHTSDWTVGQAQCPAVEARTQISPVVDHPQFSTHVSCCSVQVRHFQSFPWAGDEHATLLNRSGPASDPQSMVSAENVCRPPAAGARLPGDHRAGDEGAMRRGVEWPARYPAGLRRRGLQRYRPLPPLCGAPLLLETTLRCRV